MGFSRQEYWRALLFSSPGDLSNPGIEPESLTSPALAGGFFTAITTWGAQISVASSNYSFMAHLVPSPLQKINARVTRQLEFYPMIESGRVATVHKLPLWRILVQTSETPAEPHTFYRCVHFRDAPGPWPASSFPFWVSCQAVPGHSPRVCSVLLTLVTSKLQNSGTDSHTKAVSFSGCLEPGWDGAWSGKAPLCYPGQVTPELKTQSDPNT